jgi:hypothetical protein
VLASPGVHCPAALLPVTSASLAPAAKAALAADPARNKPKLVRAALATNDVSRGPQARRACGTQVWRRTIVVHITDRAFLPSASLSERDLFVGRTSSGYHVWLRAH